MSAMVVARMPLREVTIRAAVSMAACVWRPRCVGSGARPVGGSDTVDTDGAPSSWPRDRHHPGNGGFSGIDLNLMLGSDSDLRHGTSQVQRRRTGARG